MPPRAVDLRRRVMGWRLAERLEMAKRAEEGPMAPDASLDAAMEMCDLFPDAVGVIDATRIREVASARAAWRTLRTRRAWRTPGTTPR